MTVQTINPSLPTPGGDVGTWGDELNADLAAVISAVNTLIQEVAAGAAAGAQGLSAYQVWLSQGNVGTVVDYLASLKGPKGDPGAATVILGLVANTGLLPAHGAPGDSYLVGTTGSNTLYVWIAGTQSWLNTGVSITGPKGDTGNAGAAGTSLITGTVDPTSGVGNNGDTYINRTTSNIFGPKSAGAWGAGVSFKGAAGVAGAAGAQGPVGVIFRSWNGSVFSTVASKFYVAPVSVDPAAHGETVLDNEFWMRTP